MDSPENVQNNVMLQRENRDGSRDDVLIPASRFKNAIV